MATASMPSDFSGISAAQFQEQLVNDAVNQAYTIAKGNNETEQEAINAASQAADAALRSLSLVQNASGPRNAFTQQAVLHGLNAAGLSNAISAIQGGPRLPAYQAPQASIQANSLGQMLADTSGQNTGPQTINQPWTGQPAPAAPAPSTSGSGGKASLTADHVSQLISGLTNSQPYTPPTASTGNPQADLVNAASNNNQQIIGAPRGVTTQSYLDAVPALNKVNWSNYAGLDKDTQDFLTGLFVQQGNSANDVTNAEQQGLPQFKAPVAGSIGSQA